jgi:hypothetical protein
MPARKHDHFLVDSIKSRDHRHLSYYDGFRFGVGFFVSGLLASLIVGGLAWAIVAAFHLG